MAPKMPNTTPIWDILHEKTVEGSRVNVLGIVVGFRAPVPTRREDYKAQISLYDESIQDENGDSLLLNIFRPCEQMPDPSCGDVVLIFGAKVQRYQSDTYSLMTNWTTDIYIYSAGLIPCPPLTASKALHPNRKRPSRPLTDADNEYISIFFHAIRKERLPTDTEFNSLKTQSLNVKDKFSLLENLSDGTFADVIAEIVREPYDLGDKVTLWISDYTQNISFFSHVFKGFGASEQESDPYGYTLRFSKIDSADGDWTGPYGKMSLQITCFEPHATAIRQQRMSKGSWVLIRNLQIKYGHNAANLEGYLRGDQYTQRLNLNISLLDHCEDASAIDPRLKEAIRRKRDYERTKKRQLKSLSDATKAGQKRKAALEAEAGPQKTNSRGRRTAKRQVANQKADESETSFIVVASLNEQVKCENSNKPASLVAELLEHIYYEANMGDDLIKLQLPFINANYRINVRVVDFYPPKLEDFAFPKRVKRDYDVLSDNSDSTSSSDEEPDRPLYRFSPQQIQGWEWRFYLQLEDAVLPPKEEKGRVWVVVDNHAAQSLTDLDASNLHQNPVGVNELRQRLFILWGDLEERKAKRQLEMAAREKAARQIGPPADSDDEEATTQEKSAEGDCVQNRPFSCCIRQYGVKVPERDGTKANAGPGRRWQRMYGLYGSVIAKY